MPPRKPQVKEFPTVPIAANPYAITLGAKIKAVRLGRQLEPMAGARQLGISQYQLDMLEKGRLLPGPGLAKRLYYWVTERVSFEGKGEPSNRKDKVKNIDDWRMIKFTLPKEDAARLSKEAERLGMSQDWLVQLMVERALENKQTFATLKEAIVKLNKTRMLAALKESPELLDVLYCDLDMVAQPGIQTTPWTRIDGLKPPIVRAAELNIATEESEIEEL